jgi:acetyl-CoA C-acetyltransferase
MPTRVGIIGIGALAAQPATSGLSYKEMMFQAAQRAYLDAGIEASEVESFVTCAEDLNEGLSIFDEYTPDQLGAVQKPMHTVTADGLHGIADAVMQIQSGLVEVVVVEAHSKASNILTPDWILDYAVDPTWNRPLGFNPHALAGLEMNLFLHDSGITPDQCAYVTAKNHTNALRNPLAAYPARTLPGDVAASPYVSYPLHEIEMARMADGCVVVVLGSDDKARAAPSQPVWVRGVGFANDSATIESRDWYRAEYARIAAQMAYRHAGIHAPEREIDFFEVDDTYAYKELQHLIALGLYPRAGDAGRAAELGDTKCNGETPVNTSGGALGMGWTLEASGLYRIVELVLQLRRQAGPRQLPRATTGLAQSWRGVPTTSGAVVILSAE